MAVAALILVVASPLAGANGQTQTCVTLTYAPMGDTIDIVVQHGNAFVVMLVTSNPDDGLTLGVTVSPDVCRFVTDVKTVQAAAEMQQSDLREQVPVLP